MKILNAQQIKDIDTCSIKNQRISSWELMERASSVFVQNILKYLDKNYRIDVYCGKGNNGGDGLAIARMLADKGFEVCVLIVQHTEKASEDFNINYEKIVQHQGVKYIRDIKQEIDLSDFHVSANAVCIDAILGSGVNKPTEGIIKTVIQHINRHYHKIFSVDVPSGLFLDRNNFSEDSIVKADYTFTFQLPKLSFLFPENSEFVGEWHILDIGLSEECIAQHHTNFYTIDRNLVKSLYIPRKKVSAKWDYGHCLIVAGSNKMRGAALMCLGSALRSGCGLVTIHSIEKVTSAAVEMFPECILSIDSNDECITDIPELERYTSVCFGSGIGVNTNTEKALGILLKKIKNQKLVIDADGLNIIATKEGYTDILPPNQFVLTPHIKEFDRFFGQQNNHYDRIKRAIEAAKKLRGVIVLKSAYTAVVLPSGEVYFNTLANSALAKGGSGDVLAGLIAGLCARGYSIDTASIMGVYIHSLAGNFASQKQHPESVLPTDIIRCFSDAFYAIENE